MLFREVEKYFKDLEYIVPDLGLPHQGQSAKGEKETKKKKERRSYDCLNILKTLGILREEDKKIWYEPEVLEGGHAALES